MSELISTFLPLLLTLLIAGITAGFLAGFFGIGGGAILVPVFYQMFGGMGVDEAVRMHLSVGTSLAIIVPTSFRSFQSHLKHGQVDIVLLRSWITAIPLGVVLASVITAYLSGAGLRIIFALIAVAVSFKLLFAQEHWRLGDDLPQNPVRSLAGGIIGFFSTFMGIGGGVMNNTFMTLYGRPMHQAISTSSGVGVLISLPGAIGYILAGLWAGTGSDNMPLFTLGFVNFPTMLVVISLTLLVAPLGVKAAHLLSKKKMEKAFGVFLLLVAARFAYSLVA